MCKEHCGDNDVTPGKAGGAAATDAYRYVPKSDLEKPVVCHYSEILIQQMSELGNFPYALDASVGEMR